MRVLWIATKSPVPAIDGGRLVCAATLDALAAAGVDVTLVAPANHARDQRGLNGVRTILVQAQPRPWIAAAARSLRSGLPTTIERHAHAAVAARIAELIAREPFDVVHVEQVQAWTNASPAGRAGLACVLRAQNVESTVWAAATGDNFGVGRGHGRRELDSARDAAARRSRLTAGVLRVEARRLQRFEAAAIADADLTIALSLTDAATLASLDVKAAARIIAIAPPTPVAITAVSVAEVPLARAVGASTSTGISTSTGVSTSNSRVRNAALPLSPLAAALARTPRGERGPGGEGDALRGTFMLAGEPPFIWIGSPGWPPNDAAMRWLVEEIWPVMSARLPRARLHLFGGRWRRGVDARNPTLTWHAAPDDSRKAFAANGILLLPLRTAVGVRMRLLEAWARNVPVIASPAAVEGLDTADRRDVLIAADPASFADAAARLAADPELRARLACGGQMTLARRHDPAAIADETIAAYREAIDRRRSRRPR